MDFVHEKKPDQVVTAGFFSGTSPLSMAFALSFNVKGKIHIDFTVDDSLVQNIAKTSLSSLIENLSKFIENLKLTPFCDFTPPPADRPALP